MSSVADVTDEQAVASAVAAGVDRYGRFDVVVSNAGISGEVAPIVDYPSDVFSRTLAVHVLGAFHVLKHTIPHIPDGGSMIITSSVVGLIGPPGVSAYVAAKHGQVGLMRTAAKELAPRRIRVNTIHPGPTSTPFQDDIEMRATHLPQDESREGIRRDDPARPSYDHGGDRARDALSRRRRERDDHIPQAFDRRRDERLIEPARLRYAPGRI